MANLRFEPDWPLILAYHSINGHRRDGLAVQPADFERQIAWLHNHGYRSMTLAEFIRQSPPKSQSIVIITFDDGYTDNYTIAFPILQQYGFVATVFLVSDYMDTDRIYWWDVQEQEMEGQRDTSLFTVLNWEQVYEMLDYGIEFGSHTCTHPKLANLSPEDCWQEISRSRADLQASLKREVVSFCYPHGDLNPQVIRMVEQAGYAGAVVTPPRAGIPLGRYALRRVGVYQNNGLWLLRLKAMPLVRRYYEYLRPILRKSRRIGR